MPEKCDFSPFGLKGGSETAFQARVLGPHFRPAFQARVSGLQVGPLHNAPVVKIFQVFQVVATGAYYLKLEFENHKNQYFSWLLRSEHVKTNIFGKRMTTLTI